MADVQITTAQRLGVFYRELLEGEIPLDLVTDLVKIAASEALKDGLWVKSES